MHEGIFDLVIFDEASQLKIEDTYCAKLRGKYKVVSGDEKQMPPSDYFSSNITIDAGDDGDEDDNANYADGNMFIPDLANSESLLDFAIAKGYM